MADRTNPFAAKSSGKPDTKSRAKAQAAHDRTEDHVAQAVTTPWPLNASGKPMVQVSMTASELIPTGQYANISVGPATITMFVDPDAEDGITEGERENIANAMNQIAELVEVDVIAVQRALILASMNEQIKETEK